MAHSIIMKIQSGMADFIQSGGGSPKNIYLGRTETLELGQWAYENGYLSEPDTRANEEGINRPEVAGLKVFEVNAETHMGFAR